jgi:hypothetical protein
VPTSDPPRDRKRQGEAAPPESATEALARARRHTHSAIAEALAAIRALLDASSLALTGEASANNAVLGPLARILEGLRAEFDAGAATGEAAALLRSIAEALDAEIARWQARAESDPEARAVLRAFLGLRELLWEFGIRREPDPDPGESEEGPPRSARKAGRSNSRRRKKSRVQRVTVEG